MDPVQRVLNILKYENRIKLQNVLMKVPDREIAVTIMAMNEMEKELIFSLLGQAKVQRIKEELTYQKKLDIRKDRHLKIINKFLSYFEDGNRQFKNRSYIRPKKPGRDDSKFTGL